jgi:predicted transcriptional regulator
MNDNGENLKKKIIEILKYHPEGLTIQDLSKILKVHRQTVTKYVLVLEATGMIYRRRIGAVTLHYLKEKFVQAIKEKEILEKIKKRLEK